MQNMVVFGRTRKELYGAGLHEDEIRGKFLEISHCLKTNFKILKS